MTTPQAFPREFADIAQTAVSSIVDRVEWDDVMARVRGHVLEPGMTIRAGVYYEASVRISGVDGDVVVEGDGVARENGNSEQ